MKKQLFCIAFVLAAIIPSCEDGKYADPVNGDIPLISVVVNTDGEINTEYTYNDANLITEEKSKLFYTRHNYNSDNQLISSEFYIDESMFSSVWTIAQQALNRTEWVNPDNTPKDLTQTFDYDNTGRLLKKTYSRRNTGNTEYLEFTYENDRIIKQTGYFNNVLLSIVNYYYDDKGNLIKQEKCLVSENGEKNSCTTTEYEFDNMLNPYRAFRQLHIPGKYTNLNNIIKETYTLLFEVDPSVNKVQITNNSYEYNHKGYPTRVNNYYEYIYK